MPPPSSLAAAPAAPPPHVAAGLRLCAWRALGTQCEVRYVAASDAQAAAFEHAARSWVARFEARYSRFLPTSLVSRINTAAGNGEWIEVDPEMEQMLRLCGQLFHLTGGVLDATALPVMKLWDYRQPPTELPDAARVAAARELVGWPLVELQPGRMRLPRTGMALDFGGFGKEWAVDAVAEIARAHALEAALVDFGHDIRAVGAPPGRPAWHIGLERPDSPGAYSGSLALPPGWGIASSGDYIRGFTRDGRRYGHIVDPRTGRPVAHGLRQATVIAPTCFQAGILSTTAFVLGVEGGLSFIQATPGADGLLLTSNTRAQTRGFWNHVVS